MKSENGFFVSIISAISKNPSFSVKAVIPALAGTAVFAGGVTLAALAGAKVFEWCYNRRSNDYDNSPLSKDILGLINDNTSKNEE